MYVSFKKLDAAKPKVDRLHINNTFPTSKLYLMFKIFIFNHLCACT